MLTGKRFEDFNSDTLLFETQTLTAPLKKRIEFISGRFLVISYGVSSYTHAMVYDTALQRFGKLKLAHVNAFQYGFLDADDADTPKKQLALLQANGLVKTVEFAAGVISEDSVVLLGKFQYVRSRMLQLESVDLESVDENASCEVYDMITLDGKSFQAPILGYAVNATGLARKYTFRSVGMNHSLLIKGTFRLNSMLLTFNVHGNR
jgi:hypothetical protein